MDWSEILDAQPDLHGKLRIAGLSTVWVSDERDEKANLALALGPIDRTFGEATRAELVLVLTHHPPDWILARTTEQLSRELARLPHIHLCGHVHDAKAGVVERFGQTGRAMRYIAGAAHGDPAEEARHGVAWGALRYAPAAGRWQAGWAPRIYVAEHGEMAADRTRFPHLDADGFDWKDLDCAWPAPAG